MEGAVNVGLAYYAQWKLTDDDFGLDLPLLPNRRLGKHRVYGFGPELTVPLATKKPCSVSSTCATSGKPAPAHHCRGIVSWLRSPFRFPVYRCSKFRSKLTGKNHDGNHKHANMLRNACDCFKCFSAGFHADRRRRTAVSRGTHHQIRFVIT